MDLIIDGLISRKTGDKYHDFVKSYGNIHATDEDKKVQAEIAEPISNEWKENNHFYQNNLE